MHEWFTNDAILQAIRRVHHGESISVLFQYD